MEPENGRNEEKERERLGGINDETKKKRARTLA